MYVCMYVRVPAVMCLLFVSFPCLFLFRMRGMNLHTVSETRSGEKSPPLAPIPMGETVCTSLAPFLCRPLPASIASGRGLGSVSSDPSSCGVHKGFLRGFRVPHSSERQLSELRVPPFAGS